MKKSQFLFTVALIAVTVFSFQSQAQVPSSAEPSRAQQQITPLPSDTTLPSGRPSDMVTSSGYAEAPAGSEKVKFTLKSVTVEGVSAYKQKEVESLYSDMIGQTISLADVYGIAQRLTVKYRNDGYILTQVVVPEQTISSGNVRLRVVEGFVDQVIIRGDTGGNADFFNGFAERIRNSKPLNSKKLERYILLMNDLAGVSAKAVLSPSKTAGASDVTIVVTQKPFDVFGQIDNRGTRYLGPLQLNAGTRLNNRLGFNEGISMQAVTAFTDATNREMEYFGFSWAQPVNNEGTKVSVGGSVTSTEPGHELSTFDVKGLAHNANIEIFHPFIRSRNENLFGAFRFNYLNSTRKDNLGGAPIEDQLRVLRLAGTYQFTDRFVGINTINIEGSKGIDILGASDEGDANLTRADGDPRFVKITMEVSRLQRFTHLWEGFISVSGQNSADTLLASEEFGVGGINYGSAYDSSEITGEDGIAGRVELRANNPVQVPIDMLQLYGFYDAGKVWDRDNAVPEDRQRSLMSTGFGARATINENIAGTFEVAVPLTREVGTELDKDPRFFGSLTARF